MLEWIDSNEFEFFASPFPRTVTHLIKLSQFDRNNEPNCFGFKFKADRLTDRAYISKIVGKTDTYNTFGGSKNSKRKIIGATVTAINDKPVYTIKDVIDELHFVHENADSFEITVSDASKMSRKELTLGKLNREYIQKNLTYRFTILNSSQKAREYEDLIKKGGIESIGKPYLNG